MREDAAATARRIVEEVLAHHEREDAPATEMVATPVPSAPADDASAAAAAQPPDRDEAADEPVRDEDHEAETELLAAAGDAASVAARIARRIVAEALADADQPTGTSAAGDLHDTRPEVSVRGVPAEGLSVDDERTVGIELPDHVADTDDPPERGADPEPTSSTDTVTPPSAPGSAAEIVRQIVADVQAEATTTEDDPATSEGGPATTEDGPPTSDDDPSTVDEEPPARPDTATPDEDVASPGGLERPEPDTTAVLDEQRPEPGTDPLTQQHSVTVGATPEARAGGAPAPAPQARSERELEGWATPLNPEPSVIGPAPEGAPRTLRWLLASLLGAVALAVLFPLAVAALRALVAMD